jgi:hypothetical protein
MFVSCTFLLLLQCELPLCLPMQLYTTLCTAYFDLGAFELAKTVIKEGLDKIDALMKLQKLDPVPSLPAVQDAYRLARASLCSLQLKLQVISMKPSEQDSQVSAATPAAAKAQAGKAPLSPSVGKAAAAGAPASGSADENLIALTPLLEPLRPLLSEVSLTPVVRLTSLLEALQVSQMG